MPVQAHLLRADPNAVPGFADAALQNVSHAEIAPDLLHVHCLSFVHEG